LCRDHRRRVRPSSGDHLNAQASQTPSPDDFAAAREERRAVQAALASLPVKQCETVVLRYYESLSYDEISQVTGVSRKAVERLLARGRTALAELLSELLGKQRSLRGGARDSCSSTKQRSRQRLGTAIALTPKRQVERPRLASRCERCP
jgi:predicted DNA-binding protein (UPF0251 family)